MKKAQKVYRVRIGFVFKGQDDSNVRAVTVIAADVPEALKKTKLGKDEYVDQVELITHIDVT